MDISQKIKDLRKSKNLSQRDLAQILETTQSAVNYFENKGKDLTLGQTERIATALGVSVKELLFDEKEEKMDNNVALLELQKQKEYLKEQLDIYKKFLTDALNNLLFGISQLGVSYAVLECAIVEERLSIYSNEDGNKMYEYDKKWFSETIDKVYYEVSKDKMDYSKPFVGDILDKIFSCIEGYNLDLFIKNGILDDPFIECLYKNYKAMSKQDKLEKVRKAHNKKNHK